MADIPTLKAQERTILGKKVKNLRRDGILPGHVFGNNLETGSVQVTFKDFAQVYGQVGETGLVNLKIGEEKIRPVLIREAQYHPVKGTVLNIDFYQVNLKTKVKVYVPIEFVDDADEIAVVHSGDAVVLQPTSEVEIEALPTDLIDKIEVNISVLKNIDDAITVEQLNYDRSTIAVINNPDDVVVKLAPAVTEEMQELMEEQDAEAAAAKEAEAAAEGEVAEGEEGEAVEGETTEGGEEGTATENAESTEEKPSEE